MSATTNPNSDWTVVSDRRRRRRGRILKSNPVIEVPNAYLASPSPWTPKDPSTAPDLESELLSKILFTRRRLESSRFYCRVLSRIRNEEFKSGVSRTLSSDSRLPMVIYGIGSIATYENPRFQLALALLLRSELPIKYIEVFDPSLSGIECAVLKTLGFSVLAENEMGRRVVSAPTMFYMPHCDAALYDNLLDANWAPERLNRILLLGNSFGAYEQYVEFAGKSLGLVPLSVVARHVIAVRRFVKEVAMDEAQEEGKGGLKGRRREEKDEEHWVEKAFGDTMWHFFDVDRDADIQIL